MSHIEIFGLYLALNLLIQIVLTWRIIGIRRSEQISLGDNDNKSLRKRVRSHANFTETTPMALLGLLTLSFFQIPIWAMHGLGAAFTLGRLFHAHGMLQRGAFGKGRPIGVILTLGVFLIEALYILYLVLT